MAKTSINSGSQDAQTLNQKDIAVLDSEEPQLHLGVFLLGKCEDFHVFFVNQFAGVPCKVGVSSRSFRGLLAPKSFAQNLHCNIMGVKIWEWDLWRISLFL